METTKGCSMDLQSVGLQLVGLQVAGLHLWGLHLQRLQAAGQVQEGVQTRSQVLIRTKPGSFQGQ